jgi:hypothetical protein
MIYPVELETKDSTSFPNATQPQKERIFMARSLVQIVSIAGSLTVTDHNALLTFWKASGGSRSLANTLIASFHVKKPLTESQFRRLPNELRDKTTCGRKRGVRIDD